MRTIGAGLLACGALWMLGAGAAHAQIDPFYLDLERDAQTALARGDQAGAARLYRVACFGMLDEPDRLAACTAHLMKAQAALKDSVAFRESFLRLATVEERFQGLTRSALSPDERLELAHLAAARLPAELLAQIPALSALIAAEREAELAKAALAAHKPKEKKRRGKVEPAPAPESTEAPASATTAEVAAPAAEGAQLEAVQVEELAPGPPAVPEAEPAAASPEPVLTAPEPPPTVTEPAPTPPEPAATVAPPSDQERLELARRRSAERPERSVVEAELDAVRQIADRSPGDLGAARLAGDLAYLLGSWPVCADYYQRAGDPGPDQPLGRFYMAVCLYESGQPESAAKLIAPSADRLKRSPFVESYLSRILGPPASP